jgi:hypothetical protein
MKAGSHSESQREHITQARANKRHSRIADSFPRGQYLERFLDTSCDQVVDSAAVHCKRRHLGNVRRHRRHRLGLGGGVGVDESASDATAEFVFAGGVRCRDEMQYCLLTLRHGRDSMAVNCRSLWFIISMVCSLRFESRLRRIPSLACRGRNGSQTPILAVTTKIPQISLSG